MIEVKIEGLKQCKRPGCANTVPLSRGTKPRDFCDSIECKRERAKTASKTYRGNVRELIARRGAVR